MAEQGSRTDRATRAYRSPLRGRQVAETRRLILDSLAEVITARGTSDFTMDDVAKEAGVATATVYRHFPSRQDLLEGFVALVDERFGGRSGSTDIPERPEEVADSAALLAIIPAVMRRFDELEPLSTALVLTSNRGMVRYRRHDERTEVFRALLDPELASIADPQVRKATFAVMRHLLSAQTWFALRKEFGLDADAVGPAVAGAIEAVLHRAAGGARPVGTGRRRRP